MLHLNDSNTLMHSHSDSDSVTSDLYFCYTNLRMPGDPSLPLITYPSLPPLVSQSARWISDFATISPSSYWWQSLIFIGQMVISERLQTRFSKQTWILMHPEILTAKLGVTSENIIMLPHFRGNIALWARHTSRGHSSLYQSARTISLRPGEFSSCSLSYPASLLSLEGANYQGCVVCFHFSHNWVISMS